MNKAISIYEDLVDGFLYTAKDWLHLDLADKTIQEGKEISAAASFLFDNLFLKENAGAAISKAAREDLGNDFRPERLGSLATKMRLAISWKELPLCGNTSNGSPNTNLPCGMPPWMTRVSSRS